MNQDIMFCSCLDIVANILKDMPLKLSPIPFRRLRNIRRFVDCKRRPFRSSLKFKPRRTRVREPLTFGRALAFSVQPCGYPYAFVSERGPGELFPSTFRALPLRERGLSSNDHPLNPKPQSIDSIGCRRTRHRRLRRTARRAAPMPPTTRRWNWSFDHFAKIPMPLN